jgi:hypothetical protein
LKEIKGKKMMHETQSVEAIVENPKVYIDEQLLPLQRIDGTGPPNKIDLNTLPKPLRIFGYALFVGAILMLLLLGYVSFFR